MTTSGIGNFDKDRWELFHTDEDRSEAHDLAEWHPERVAQLVSVWFAEAGRTCREELEHRVITGC